VTYVFRLVGATIADKLVTFQYIPKRDLCVGICQ
jgi:hypothetical protein